MSTLPLTSLVTLVTIILFFFMGLRVAKARGTYNIPAPATSGDPIFERHFRVQMNTLEWLPMFLPALWLAAIWQSDMVAAGLGLVWIIGRIIYMLAYVADPKTRSLGFVIQMLATLVLILLTLFHIGSSML
ncbi:MAG: MAPEG family protein [Hyphomonadaceae bacterium]|jgi:glutathione S-transferase|uniref:MAPEG family protein n=1 Tax=Aquidulcibacter sp. TaxID=2052990 RepID=UPI0022C37182|nr:MAPEG family protein [Aquidulcibacter sp.]MCE2890895.1 MAPEG family protein [Hyphomonadaceae bacterium]MCZ8210001.1 MAPEG family protein [Aquidulcibacter sp.]